MKNNIQEDYVSFELAKLLKKKEFDIIGEKWYSVEGGLYYQDEFDNNRGFIPVLECEAPTLSLAQKWVYENFGIWVNWQPTYNPSKYQVRIYISKNNNVNQHYGDYMSKDFNSPQEALEVGLIYTLKELI